MAGYFSQTPSAFLRVIAWSSQVLALVQLLIMGNFFSRWFMQKFVKVDESHTGDPVDESHSGDSAKSPEWYLHHARECMEQAQQMTSGSAEVKLNHNQCDYLVKELKVAVEESEQSFKRSSSHEHQAECVEILKLLHKVALEIKAFIQGSCHVSIVLGSASASMPIRVTSWTYHLKLCTVLLSNSNRLGAAWRTWKELKGFSERDILSFVKEKSSRDYEDLFRNMKSLIPDHKKLDTILREGYMDFSKETSLQQLEALGKGSASIVHGGIWKGEQVAIKTYYDVATSDFIKEVPRLLSLRHPNIVNILGYASDKGDCIVMELMDGNLFSEMLLRSQKSSSGAPFTILEAVGFMRQVAEAMNYLHESNISHGELKSQNILVKMEMGSLIAKISDFKIARPDPNLTLIDLKVKESSRWVAPELIHGTSNRTRILEKQDVFKGDIYSFAMVCYEILTGNQPFSELTLQQAEDKALLGHRPKLSDLCPPDLKNLIERCWNSNPLIRPSSIDVCEELKFLQCLLLSEPLAPQIQTHPLILPPLVLPSCLLHMKVDYSCLHRGMQLGKGASETIVYSTTWHHNGVKKCVAQKLYFGGVREDFKKEITILADLIQCPNIACLLCYAIDNRSCSIVMEKMDRDLNDLIRYRKSEIKSQTTKLKTTPPFSLHVAIDIMLQIAKGVHYMHQKNVVHRDLKSSNILISKAHNGKEFQVKVADFGLSQMILQPSSECLPDPFNVGTLKWMAPEVMMPKNSVTKSSYNPFKSDVYSFGMVCFEILTGKVPTFETTHSNLRSEKALISRNSSIKFKHSGEVEDPNEVLMRAVLAGSRPPFSDYCPSQLEALIKNCWDSDTSARPAFAEIIAQLEDIKKSV